MPLSISRNLLAYSLLAVALTAQTGAPRVSIPSCNMKDCKCMDRVDKIQAAAMAVCNAPNWREFYKTKGECYADRYVDRCSVAEAMSPYDTYEKGGTARTDDGHEYAMSDMGPMCSKACLKHDCKCGTDSTPTPVCHFGHDPSEHHNESGHTK